MTKGLVITLLFIALAAQASAQTSALPVSSAQSSAVARSATAPGENPELTAFKSAIRAKYDLRVKTYATHTTVVLADQFFTPDAIVAASREGSVAMRIGHAQIRAAAENVVKDFDIRIDSVYTFVSGDAGWDWADLHVQPMDGAAPYDYAILFLWARIDGQWMCKGEYAMRGGSFRTANSAVTPGPPVSELSGGHHH